MAYFGFGHIVIKFWTCRAYWEIHIGFIFLLEKTWTVCACTCAFVPIQKNKSLSHCPGVHPHLVSPNISWCPWKGNHSTLTTCCMAIKRNEVRSLLLKEELWKYGQWEARHRWSLCGVYLWNVLSRQIHGHGYPTSSSDIPKRRGGMIGNRWKVFL